MKIYEIVAEKYYPTAISNLDEGARGKLLKYLLPSRKSKGLAPKSKKAKEYRDMRKQNKADAAANKAARDASARKYAERKIANIPNAANALVSIGGVAYYVNDYFNAIGLVEVDWQEYKKNNYTAEPPNRFAGMPYEQAIIQAEKDRQALLGKATLGIITTSGFITKFVGWMGKGVQFSGLAVGAAGATTTGAAAVMGGKLLTKISEAMAKVNQKLPLLSPALRASFATLMEQDFMKVVTQHALAYMVFGAIGSFTSRVVGTLNTALQTILTFMKDKLGIDVKGFLKDKLGIDLDKYTDTPIKRDPVKEKEIADKQKAKVANFINGVDVTDADGYLTTDTKILTAVQVQDAIDRAHLKGLPNPLDKFKRKPGAVYPTDIMVSRMPGPGYKPA